MEGRKKQRGAWKKSNQSKKGKLHLTIHEINFIFLGVCILKILNKACLPLVMQKYFMTSIKRSIS